MEAGRIHAISNGTDFFRRHACRGCCCFRESNGEYAVSLIQGAPNFRGDTFEFWKYVYISARGRELPEFLAFGQQDAGVAVRINILRVEQIIRIFAVEPFDGFGAAHLHESACQVMEIFGIRA